MGIDWITYRGKRILFSDYSGMPEDKRIEQLKEEEQAVLNSPEPVLLLHNISRIPASKDLMKALKAQQAKIRSKVARSACIGIAGLQHVFLTAVNRIGGAEMKPFTEKSEALNWLVGEH